MRKVYAFLAALSLFCMSLPAFGISFGDPLGLSPFWDWKTIETEHFRVTFPAELAPQAQKSAKYLEEAHGLLSKRLYWSPKFKTQVLVIDNADAANGLTMAATRFGMVFYVTPPDNWFSTAYYDDWLRLLVIHEYTHFLNLDPTFGVWSGLRLILGDVLLPNSFWPIWMLEGLAVYQETALTRAGRGRSTLYEMLLRTAVEENVLDSPDYITLDKVNGENPWHPAGETPYLFGYQLMNRVEQDTENALGVMSWRSGGRFPWFINGNLENITGNDWYGFWDLWVKETRARATEDLAKIKSQPLSPIDRVPGTEFSSFGPTPSPDGKWLAHTQDSSDRRMGLWLRNLESGKSRRIQDKLLGVGMAFTPDSRSLLFSALRRKSNYYLWSDLAIYDLETEKTQWLTDSLRARDPDVSYDGKWVVFTTASKSGVGLSMAALIRNAVEPGLARNEWVLSPPRTIFDASPYDRASTPKFSRDGKTIVFSFHKNGQAGEEILELSPETGKVSMLVSDGHMNRFPTFDSRGRLYFISDKTGVDNLYRLDAGGTSRQLTNTTTGLWMPAFAANDAAAKEVWASVFSTKGWGIGKVELASTPISSLNVTVSAPPAPPPYESSPPLPSHADYPVEDYSVIPSIWPRQWFPILLWGTNSFYLGGQVLGYDAVDRHRYLLAAAYETELKNLDTIVGYSNRSLGPTLNILGSQQTQSITRVGSTTDQVAIAYTRKFELSADLSFPFRWTWSTLVPSIGFNAERETRYGLTNGAFEITRRSRYVPSADAVLAYSDAEGSRLAISTERGRMLLAGVRAYEHADARTYKGLVKNTQHFDLGKHVALVPSLRASMTSHANREFISSNVLVSGRINRLISSRPADDFDQLSLRGYPEQLFIVRAASVGSLDLRFPIARIFRGWGTNPVFFENLHGFVFGETALLPTAPPRAQYLPAAGAGLNLDTEFLIHVPFRLSLEYHKGFKDEFGGQGELFFGLNLGALAF